MAKIRVLIVDDHAALRHSLAQALQSEPAINVVGEAPDGSAAIRLARQLKPDVVLMDVMMPGVNGIEATRQIARECPKIRIIGLSVHDSAACMTRMLEAGAAAYLLKDCDVEDLTREIIWGGPPARQPHAATRSRARMPLGVR